MQNTALQRTKPCTAPPIVALRPQGGGMLGFILKSEQPVRIKYLCEGQGVFLWLPTGSGMSLCYKVLSLWLAPNCSSLASFCSVDSAALLPLLCCSLASPCSFDAVARLTLSLTRRLAMAISPLFVPLFRRHGELYFSPVFFEAFSPCSCMGLLREGVTLTI